MLTKFYEREPEFYFFTKFFKTTHQSVYVVLHACLLLAILAAYFLLQGGNAIFIPLSLYGIVFFTEVHHVIKGIIRMNYYPGMLTAVFFPILGYFYWTELLKLWK